MAIDTFKCAECGFEVANFSVGTRGRINVELSKWIPLCNAKREANGMPLDCPHLKKAVFGPHEDNQD